MNAATVDALRRILTPSFAGPVSPESDPGVAPVRHRTTPPPTSRERRGRDGERGIQVCVVAVHRRAPRPALPRRAEHPGAQPAIGHDTRRDARHDPRRPRTSDTPARQDAATAAARLHATPTAPGLACLGEHDLATLPWSDSGTSTIRSDRPGSG